jgi:hypothetical protein
MYVQLSTLPLQPQPAQAGRKAQSPASPDALRSFELGFEQLKALEHQLSKSAPVRPQELLLAQISVQRIQIRVELATKVADAASTSFKRLTQAA